MKVAIACEGNNLNAFVSDHPGRAAYYLIFENGQLNKSLENPLAAGGRLAGINVAKMLVAEGVEKVVAGSFGPNMLQVLENNNIQTEIFHGRVKDYWQK